MKVHADMLEETYGITDKNMEDIAAKVFDAVLQDDFVDAAGRCVFDMPKVIEALEQLAIEDPKASKVMFHTLSMHYLESLHAQGAISEPSDKPDMGKLQ